MKAAGAVASAIAEVVGKTTTQVNNKWTWLKDRVPAKAKAGDDWPEAVKPDKPQMSVAKIVSAREAEIAALMASVPDVAASQNGRLTRADIPKILRLLGKESWSVVAGRTGESKNTIDGFLKRCGIDYRTLPPEEPAPAPRDPVKPMMKFKTVAIRDSWGNDNEIQVAEPLAVEKDPASGATVTKYQPGYAFGAHPPRSVHVKGGS